MSTSFVFPVEEFIYGSNGTRDLKLYVFRPQSTQPKPAILFFHGGSFGEHGGTISQFQYHAKHYASKGFVTMCVDCTNGSDIDFTPIQAISDARAAFNWIQKHAKELEIDPNQIFLSGGSSGGYTVLCSLMIESHHAHDNQEGCIPAIELMIFNAGVDGIEITNRRWPELNDIAIEQL